MPTPTLDNAFAEARKNGRVCPNPIFWNELYELLPDRKRVGQGWEPPLPLILAAWWDAPALSKYLRLREHLEWAAQHGCLASVIAFMRALPESDWHHYGE